ncbi:MAG: hypothetical protein RLZZ387_4205 [Chloroflexota bacterium]|jgi:quercetin dioxygenase-like cupin family protein
MALSPEYVIDVARVLREVGGDGPIWSVNSEQLNANLVRLTTGAGIDEHVNREVDVLLVVFEGRGELIVEGVATPLEAGHAVLIPLGVARALRCTAGPLVYITCHRRRAGLMPTWPGEGQPQGA